ncbi:OLC1v1004439C1 [Oldenlandia corymbosa var. corymbosa]|uniref:OLC1v1004439C1 n=1 Tax=Oldenlandia corymbosa var. corymbosa TaxID=529605 RepID=A0AAV1DEZ3_OLDCO|nr:OLC1v1004439C1 [Oldenlandia corymbosa var. corymbosa]
MDAFAAIGHHDDAIEEALFLDDDDIIHEISDDDDDEELPDAEDDEESFDAELPGELYTVACSPTDPHLVATGGKDEKVLLRNIGQGDCASKLEGHSDSISSLAFSSDGQLLASGSADGLVKVWNVSSRTLECTFDGPTKEIEWVKWHPNEHLVLAGSKDKTVWMWNAERRFFLNVFAGHGGSVTCGDFTPDGRMICTGSKDALRIWNGRSGEIIHMVTGHTYPIKRLTCLSLSSDSTLALTGSKSGSVHLVQIATGQVIGSLTAHSDSVLCTGFASSSSQWAATGGRDQKLVVWDLHNLNSRCICEHEGVVVCLTWLGASRYLATGCDDGKVQIWDSLSGECVRIFSSHDRSVQSLAVSANDDFLVSVSYDETTRFYEISGFK